jgi:hypothetical protein
MTPPPGEVILVNGERSAEAALRQALLQRCPTVACPQRRSATLLRRGPGAPSQGRNPSDVPGNLRPPHKRQRRPTPEATPPQTPH